MPAMINYEQPLLTDDQALQWLQDHPNGIIEDSQGNQSNALPGAINVFGNPPYTIVKTGNTITVDGAVYREGDNCANAAKFFIGCIVEISPGHSPFPYLKILYIPDEVADKPALKEPKTLTLEEVCAIAEEDVFYLINEITKEVEQFNGPPTAFGIPVLKVFIDNGGNLYPTPEDAELGKERGMK